MVTEKKWIVDPIYIQNHDIYKFVCEYYQSVGKATEILRSSSVTYELCKGFYVNVNGRLIGLFESKNGPILFKNERQFLLQKGKFKFDLEEKLTTRVFTLKIDQIEKFKIEYEKPKYFDYDVWSSEEFVDFFLWLYNSQFEDNFHKTFTIYD